MNPMLLSALLSFAPGLLSHLFGGDPQKKLQKQLLQLASPQNMQKQTNQFYQGQISSPAFSQAQGDIASGANQASNQLAQRLGAMGIGQSGTGAVLSSLTPSLVGSQQAGLRTSAFNSAQQQAQTAIEQQMKALTGTQGPSQSQQLFGVGMDAFGPMLNEWLKKYLGGGGGLPNQSLFGEKNYFSAPGQIGGTNIPPTR